MADWLRLLLICWLLAGVLPTATAAPNFDSAVMAAALSAFRQGPTMGHPRLFKGQADFHGIAAAAKNERAVGLKAMEGRLRRTSVRSMDPEFVTNVGGVDTVAGLNNWFKQERVLEGMAEAALAWYLTGDVWYLDELLGRMLVTSPLILGSRCMGEPVQTRAYAWYFALAYDFAFPALSPREKERFKDVIKACASAALPSIITDVTANPRNGVAFHALGKFIGALLIVLGDTPEADNWLELALPAYVPKLSPWGGNDGGYANGTSYALWDAGDSLLIWDLLDRVLAVPIYQKPWLSELPRFVTYNLPPGTPAGAFGDGAELNRKEEWARFGKAIMSRYDAPLARWYENQLFGDDPSRLHNLLSPRVPVTPVPWPVGELDSRQFSIVGWVAMHSSIADRNRVSIYFKSSPYGSFNHSHADQNSFIVHAHGEVLAMDSGYYDYYNSPHWRYWYKQTRAHNAITFDGGKGQNLGADGLGTGLYAGKITQFVTTAEYDLVSGDATSAYGDQASLVKRTLVFLKPATLVIIDRLGSYVPRKWEWNLHTNTPLVKIGWGYKLTVNGVDMCVRVASPEVVSLRVESGYSPMPEITNPIAPHYWNRFSYRYPNVSGLFVSVLRVDCSTQEPNISFDEDKAEIDFESKAIYYRDGNVIVR